ncbi:MAG: dihydrofolate reductase [Candidatus Pacebacteria bacterium]|nr:dihydrofolate reductase [Candidatus Paceibacterota bacterium]
MISIIVAASINNVIGNKGKIPWYIPRDFKYFKETTMGHPIVMGRKTFESIGKPLPGRENIILSRKEFEHEGCKVVHSLEEILSIKEDVFVIGGSEIYRQFLSHADKIYLTRVHKKVDGDTTFPEIDSNEWSLIDSRLSPKENPDNLDITFEVYERRK